jgi:hypothetical protein
MGLTMFKNIIATGRWEPSKGANLKTFFIGQCLIQFPTVYGDWHRGQRRYVGLAEVIKRQPKEFYPSDPARDLKRRLEEAELSTELSGDPYTKAIVRLKLQGYKQAEIAELLDTTEGAVQSRLYRLRQKGVPWTNNEM